MADRRDPSAPTSRRGERPGSSSSTRAYPSRSDLGTVRRVDSGGSDRLLRSHLATERPPTVPPRRTPVRGTARTPPRPENASAPRVAPRGRGDDPGVESNARLTGLTAAVLFVLFAVEGVTVLQIRSLLTPHVFIGMLLVPPILLKMGSTGWRFARYYLGSPAYRRKGPPPPILRLLGPLVIVLTVTLFASGIAALLGPVSIRSPMLLLHKASFVVWLLVMAVHVLGHLLDTASLAPRDFVERTRRQVDGARLRQWVVAASLGVGLILGVAVIPKIGPWLGWFSGHAFG